MRIIENSYQDCTFIPICTAHFLGWHFLLGLTPPDSFPVSQTSRLTGTMTSGKRKLYPNRSTFQDPQRALVGETTRQGERPPNRWGNGQEKGLVWSFCMDGVLLEVSRLRGWNKFLCFDPLREGERGLLDTCRSTASMHEVPLCRCFEEHSSARRHVFLQVLLFRPKRRNSYHRKKPLPSWTCPSNYQRHPGLVAAERVE